MLKFHRTYFGLTVLIFAIEVLIALFVHDGFVRPYLGDVLVVVLIYCFVRSFFTWPVFITAFGVLVFSFIIEFFQYLDIIKILGLKQSTLARTVLGTSFSWIDMLAYTTGFALIVGVEKIRASKKGTTSM